MGWDYYHEGQYFKHAGFRIVEVMVQGLTMQCTIYRVRMECCGKLRYWTHNDVNTSIRKRERTEGKREYCSLCATRSRNPIRKKGKPYPGTAVLPPDIDLTLWPDPPSSVPRGNVLWCDRMGRRWNAI